MRSARIHRAALAAISCSLLASLLPVSAHAQVVTPFGSRFSANVAGDIAYVGNSLQTCPDAVGTCAAARLGTATPIANNNNNAYSMIHIDVDTDTTTFNSSRAGLNLPAGADTLFAGLYWSADLSAGTGGSAPVNAALANSVRLQLPGQSSYQTVNGSRIGTTGSNYASFANITALVQQAGNGAYTVANVQAGTGGNRYAGWTLVVVYQAPGTSPRNLTVFDGYATVSNSTSVTIPITGFTAPLSGTVNARVGALVFEGDLGLVGDRLRLNGTDLSNALNPVDNFFNSTYSLFGTRYSAKTPDYPNLMAVDADLLNTTGIIANGATSASVTLSTSGDAFFPAVVSTAIDLYAPNVGSSKSGSDVNGGQLIPGDLMDYTITVANSGLDPASNVILTDPIPAGTTFVPGSLQVVAGANSGSKSDAAGDDQAEFVSAQNLVRFRLGSGANASAGGTLTTSGANASTTVRFRVSVNPDAGNATVISNQAQVSYNAATLGTPLSGSSNVSGMPVATPVLSLTKSAAPDPVLAGGELVYTLAFANNGSAAASGTVLTDTLPANTTFVSATGGGAFDAGTQRVTWNFGALAPGASGSVSLRVRVGSPLPNGSILANTATLGAANAGATSSSVETTVASAPFLTLEKQASETVVGGGDKLTYTLAFRNAGTDTANAVVLTDVVPANTTFFAANGGGVYDPGTNVVTWNLGAIPAGTSGSVSMVVQLDTPTPNGTLITNSATIGAANAADATAAVTVTASTEPVLTLTKDGAPDPVLAGGSLSYTLAFRNIGTDIARDVVLVETIPARTRFVSASGGGVFDATANTVTWSLGDLGVETGGSVALTVQVDSPLPNGTSISNTASIQSAQTPPVSASDDVIVASQPRLTLAKRASAATANAGGEVAYTFDYANTGSDQATNVVLTDLLPANTTFVGASAGGTYDAGSNTVTWALGAVPAGVSGSVGLTLRIATPLPNGTVIQNVGSLAADGLPPLDATASVVVSSAPTLAVSKTATPDPVAAGDQLTYVIDYSNTGSDSATAAVLSDPLPLNTTFVAASAGGTYDGATNTVTWPLGTIPAGSNGSVSLVVAVASPLDDGTRLLNSVSLASSEVPPVAASISTTVSSAPALAIEKTADQSPVAAGNALTYTLRVGNTGNANASGVTVVDALPAEATFISASDGGTFDAATGAVTWVLSSLATGEVRLLTLQIQVATPLPNGTLLINQASIDSDQTAPVGTRLDVPVASSPVLGLTKIDDVDPVNAGGALSYTIAYTNTGNDSAIGAIITDTLPGNVTFVSASAGGSFDPVSGQVSWTLGTVPAGASASVTLDVQVDSPLPSGTQITNNAAINADNAQPASASAGTTVNSAPALALSKRVDAELVAPGATLVYTLDYANNGNDQAGNAVITDSLPANTSFVAASAGGSYDAGSNTVTWVLGNVAAGSTGSVELTVQVASPLTDGTAIVNSATVNADNAQPVSANASSIVNSAPVLTLAKSVDDAQTEPGATLAFTLTYGNTGDDAATGVRLVDALPAGTTFVSASGGGIHDPATSTVTWELGTVASGASGTLTVTVQLPSPMPNGTVIANNATLTAANGAAVAAQASAIVVSAPVLAVTKTASQDPIPAGGQLTYSISIANSGNDDANELRVTDLLPANTTFVSADTGGSFDPATSTVSWTIESIAAGSSVTVVLTVQVASPLANGTAIANTASASANNAAPVSGSVTVTVASSPVLTLAKSASADPVIPGQSLTYTINYGNGGDDQATNAVIVDTLPADVTFVSASAGGVHDPGANTVTWSLGNVPAGASGSVSVTVTVATPLPDGTVLVNQASIEGDNAAPASAAVGVSVDSAASLTLAKFAAQNQVPAGSAVDFTLVYENRGTDVARTVVLTDPLPANVTFVSASAGGIYDPAANTVTWALGDLPAGTGGNVTLSVQVASPLPNGTQIQNTAQLLAANATPANASATIAVDSNPVLSLAKAALDNPVTPGATLGFALSYANTGTDVAANAVIADPLPANTSFVSASDGGTYDAATNTVTWLLGDLAAGTGGSRSLVVQVDSPLGNGTTIVNVATLSADGLTPVSASGASTVSSAGTLTLDKTASAQNVQPGQTVVYTLAYANTGDDEAANAVLIDPLPAGTVFVEASAGGSFDPAANRVTWSLGTIAAGDSGSVSLTVTIASPLANGKVIVNSASLGADGLPPVEASAVIVVDSAPLLTLSKSAARDPVQPGTELTYTLVYGNAGNANAVNAVVVDPLPADTTFVSASAGGTYDAGSNTVTWSLGALPAGSSGTLQLAVRIADALADGTTITNSASLTADNAGPVEAAVAVTVDSSAVLSLSKVASTPVSSPGGVVSYTLNYGNTGNDAAIGTTISDPLPANTTFVSADAGGVFDPGTETVTWAIGDVPAGAGGTVSLDLRIVSPLPNGTVIVNTATISAEALPSTSASAPIGITSAAGLTLDKSASQDPVQPGATLVYTMLYANTGNDAATLAVLTDPIPANASFLAASSGGVFDAGSNAVTWSLGTVPAGATGSVTLTVAIDDPLADGTVIINTANLSADGIAPITAATPVTVDSSAVLSLLKTAASDSAAPGDLVEFTLDYANSGSDVAANAVIADPIPAGTSFVSASVGGTYDPATDTVRWSLGDLAAGAGGTVSMVVRLDSALAAGTIIANTATLSADGLAPVDGNASLIVAATDASTLTLAKTASPSPVAAGGLLTYTLSYGVEGQTAVTNALLVDALPASTRFVTASGGGSYDPASDTVSWSLGNLPAGTSSSVTLVVRVDADAPIAQVIVNTAELSGDGTGSVSSSVETAVSGAVPGGPPTPVPSLSILMLAVLIITLFAVAGARLARRASR